MQSPQIIHLSHPSLTSSDSKVTYQKTVTEPLHTPVISNAVVDTHTMSQNQVMLSHQQHLQAIQPLQSQVLLLQSTEITQPLQVFLPQVSVFKQQMLVDGVQQQYECPKEPCFIAKLEPELPVMRVKEEEQKFQISDRPVQSNSENAKKRRPRSQIPNPSMWASNIRKQKHERGEEYINRRGKYVPERKIKTTKDCLHTCKYKCNEYITDSDREHIFKAFYSLSTNEKKHFLLNTTERNCVKHGKVPSDHKRKYVFKYFFLVRAVKYTVCKNFYLGTLSISQKPVYNVHLGKSDVNVPKPDGRGLSEASTQALPSEAKERVRKHIMSFETLKGMPVKQFSKKKQYLESSLNIKHMFKIYLSDCSKDSVTPVKESMYRKIFKEEFNLHFVKVKEQPLCAKCKCVIKKEC